MGCRSKLLVVTWEVCMSAVCGVDITLAMNTAPHEREEGWTPAHREEDKHSHRPCGQKLHHCEGDLPPWRTECAYC